MDCAHGGEKGTFTSNNLKQIQSHVFCGDSVSIAGTVGGMVAGTSNRLKIGIGLHKYGDGVVDIAPILTYTKQYGNLNTLVLIRIINAALWMDWGMAGLMKSR